MLALDVQITFPGFDLDVAETCNDGDIVALFGPSGAGKSTLLRIIAGLESEARGQVRYGEEYWQDSQNFVPTYKRGAILVFQDSHLFPHFDVEANLRFGLKRDGGRSGPNWQEVINILQLDDLVGRQTLSLSGGERQRVALGRALLASPRLLLLDEPMSALDAARRADLWPQLLNLFQRFEFPVICVSHSPRELQDLGARPLEMKRGHVTSRSWMSDGELLARVKAQRTDGLYQCDVAEQVILAKIPNGGHPDDVVTLNLQSQYIILARDRVSELSSFGQIPVVLQSFDCGPSKTWQFCFKVDHHNILLNFEHINIDEKSLDIHSTMYLIFTQPPLAVSAD